MNALPITNTEQIDYVAVQQFREIAESMTYEPFPESDRERRRALMAAGDNICAREGVFSTATNRAMLDTAIELRMPSKAILVAHAEVNGYSATA